MALTELERPSKIMTLEEAAGWVSDGMKLSVGGMALANAPNAFVREIIRRGIKDLTIIPTNSTGYQTDLLIGAGCVKKLYSSYVGLDYIGLAPNYRRFAETGRLDIVDLCELGLMRALKAQQSGSAFFPLPPGIMANDNVKNNPDWYRVVEDPFTGQKVVVVPPLKPDICVVHTALCDAYGNGRELGHVDGVSYLAAKKVIVTTEKIVSLEDTESHYKEVTVYGQHVDAVVEVPWGSHPAGCHGGGYMEDAEHLKAYLSAGCDDDTFKKYLDKYVYGCSNNVEYLEKIGVAALVKIRN